MPSRVFINHPGEWHQGTYGDLPMILFFGKGHCGEAPGKDDYWLVQWQGLFGADEHEGWPLGKDTEKRVTLKYQVSE